MADDPQPVEQEQPAGEPEVLDAVPVPDGAVTTSAVADAMERQHEELDHFSPAGRALVITDPADGTGVLQVLDRHDELLILNRLQAKSVGRKLFYSFNLNGSRVTELSVQGVAECIGEMNATGKVKIGIDRDREPRFELELADTEFAGDVQHVVCTVYAHDEVTKTGFYGTFSQPRKFRLTEKTAGYRRADGKYVPDDLILTDPFARQKALNKAERNALRKLIPEFIAQTLIAAYTGNAALVKEIKVGPGAAALAELPPPLTDDRAQQLLGEARELYSELQRHDPGGRMVRVTPAYFHSMEQRAQHSHELLEGFVKYVAEKRDRAIELANAAA